MTDHLTGKIAWVTGSGRGIGRSTAIAFAKAGAQVVLCARSQSDISAVAAEINNFGGIALAIQCDVSKRNQIRALVERTTKELGKIDILVNNAGVAFFRKVIDIQEHEWDQMMSVNLKGALLCTQAVLNEMINNRSGKIINIISVGGKKAFTKCSGYCASKFGLLGFTEVLRLETRQYGIQVTAIIPGATNTIIWGNSNIDRSKMMSPDHVAQSIIAICCSPPEVMPEEFIIRPIGGDL